VYVKDSVEAVRLYQEAFGATLSNEARNSDGTFLHVELDVCGHIIALSERKNAGIPGNTMQFCFHYGEGHDKAVERAYQVLKEGSQILHPIGPCFFSPCMAGFIDKFGVNWCLYV
jgi:PhnB protein